MNYSPNQTNQQQPYQYKQVYQSNQPPMITPTPVSKKPRRIKNLGWISIVIIVFFIGIAIGHTGSGTDSSPTIVKANNTTTSKQPAQAHSTPVATPTPTAAPTWQTTHTYSGNGAKKTETITVPDDWKIQWTCDPNSFYGGQYNVIVGVNNSDSTPADPAAINTMCQSGNTSGETEEHQSGTVYLDVNSEGSWTITIQELK